MPLVRFIRSFSRFIHILALLLKQGILYLGLLLGLYHGPRDDNGFTKDEFDKARFARITLEKLGPTFIKFGQFMSVRPELVSAAVREEFRNLQDNVAPFPGADAKDILDSEYKLNHSEIFSNFDETPLASASISQVHIARLHSGEQVAVKIQRPGIRKEMAADIIIMGYLAYLLDRLIPSIRKNRPRMLVREFSKWTARELDFKQEAKNAAHFYFHFQDFEGVKYPAVYLDLTTKKVLVMEYISGKNLLEVPKEEIDTELVTRRITESMLKQIFQDGFFHGDPHPGNIFILEGGTIAYLDFGIVGYLTKDLREWSFDCLFGMAEGDISRVIDSFLELCNVNEDEIDVPRYRRRINEVLGDLHVCQICEIPFSSILEKFLNTSLEHGLYVPSDVVIMSKAITTLEGTLQAFAPDVKIIDFLKPYAQQYLVIEPDLNSVWERITKGPYETGRWGRLISRRLDRVISSFERGSIRLESDEFKQIVREMDKSSVNMSYGVIIAALIIFAAFLSNDTVFEDWLRTKLDLPEIPILPIVSLALAGYLSIRLYLRNRIRNDTRL